MPSPSSTTAVPNTQLTQYVSEFAQAQEVYSGLVIFPPLAVADKTGQFDRIPAAAMSGLPDVDRAPSGHYNTGEYDVEGDTYSCVEYGWEERVDDSTRNVFRNFWSTDQVAAERGMHHILRRHNARSIALVEAQWALSGTTGVNLSTTWGDASAGVPITDVQTGIETIFNQTGVEPDTLVIPRAALRYLSVSAQILDRVKYTNTQTGNGVLPLDLLAMALGVQRLFVDKAMYNTAADGLTESLSRQWGDYAFLCCTGTGNDLRQPQVGRTFVWDADGGLLSVEQYRDESRRSDIIRTRQHVDEKFFGARFGYRIGNILP